MVVLAVVETALSGGRSNQVVDYVETVRRTSDGHSLCETSGSSMKEDNQRRAPSGSPAARDSQSTGKHVEPVESIMPHDPSSTAGRDAFGDVTDFGIQEEPDDPERK